MTGHLNAPVSTPPFFSTNERKRIIFPQESYFQEALYNVFDILGPDASDLKNVTFILFKPDAAPARCVEPCLCYLAERGIAPFYTTRFRFNRYMIRELWRYELNVSTRQRYAAIDSFLDSSESLLVMLQSDYRTAGSLSEEVKLMKGSSEKAKRSPEHIRARLDAPDGTLNYIHTPDEIADLVREIGVLLEERDRIALFTAIANRKTRLHGSIQADVAAFYENVDEEILHIEAIVDKMIDQRPAHSCAVKALLEWARQSNDFHSVQKTLIEQGFQLSFWETVSVFVSGRKFAVDHCVPVLEASI